MSASLKRAFVLMKKCFLETFVFLTNNRMISKIIENCLQNIEIQLVYKLSLFTKFGRFLYRDTSLEFWG